MKKLSILSVFLVMVVFVVSKTPVLSQPMAPAWKPSGPITMIVGQGPGGGFDSWARAISAVLPKYVGVPVVVKNVPGLGGATGMETLWRSKPDGYTIMLFEGWPMLSAQYLLGFSYDVQKLTFIGTVHNVPFAIFVAKASAFNSLQDFVSAGKTKSMRGGTTGLASGLWQSMAIFAKEAGIDVKPVAGYQSGADLFVGLEAGDFDGMFMALQGAIPSLKRGSIRTLAVAGTSPDPRVPDVRTFAEMGFPKTSTSATSMKVVTAPPGTPPHISNFHERAFLAIMNDSKFLEWVKSQNDLVDPLNGKQTIELFKRLDKVVAEFLPVLKQYVK
jgi:tripartite-type tricarboxylate transporter receptor subunit TctC